MKFSGKATGFKGKELDKVQNEMQKTAREAYAQHQKNTSEMNIKKSKLQVTLTIEQWMWMHTLIGETQGTLTCIAMQSTDEEHKHFIAPCLQLEKDWDLFIEKIRENIK